MGQMHPVHAPDEINCAFVLRQARQEHDPEKCVTVFRKRSCSNKIQNMIRKSVKRFSERIMLKQNPEHDPEKCVTVFQKDHAQTKSRT